MHNALDQIQLRCGGLTLAGFSISGLATYLQVPELDVCFDMGECPLSAVPLRHVLLTHAHGDHARCVLRHSALRRMLGLAGDASYFMPADIAANFVVDHRGVPSLGYTILERRKKLLDHYAALAGAEIAALRRTGVQVSVDVDVPAITFIGDCVAHSLHKPEVWQAPVLVIEATYVDPDDREMAASKGHTHIDEIGALLSTMDPATLPAHIVLKHFSMKVSRNDVDVAVARAIPEALRSRVQLLLS
jgi:ribonuclease Z